MSKPSGKTEFEKKLEQKAAEEQEQRKEKERTGPPVHFSTEPGESQERNSGSTEEQGVQWSRLQQDLSDLTSECDCLRDQLLRVRADFDNYRKRTLRENEQLRQYASEKVIGALLPVLDNLERALSHATESDGLAAGLHMVLQQLQDILSSEGLTPILAAGMPFDPNVHEALSAQPSETTASGLVLEEYERGYMLYDKVLRPSRVIVSSGSIEAYAEPSDAIPEAMIQESGHGDSADNGNSGTAAPA